MPSSVEKIKKYRMCPAPIVDLTSVDDVELGRPDHLLVGLPDVGPGKARQEGGKAADGEPPAGRFGAVEEGFLTNG